MKASAPPMPKIPTAGEQAQVLATMMAEQRQQMQEQWAERR